VILLPHSVRIYVASEPVSLRKSFEGLSNEVRSALAHDPLSGHLFLFLNKSRTQMKCLMWTRGGFTIMHKSVWSGDGLRFRTGWWRARPRSRSTRTSCRCCWKA